MNAIIKNPIILKIFISSSFPSNTKLQKDEIEIEPIVANNTNIETGPYSTPIIQIIVVEVTDIASKIDNINVKKSNIPVTSIKLNKQSARIKDGDTLSLSATITPSNATVKTISWSSSDEDVATVSSNGYVVAFDGLIDTFNFKVS